MGLLTVLLGPYSRRKEEKELLIHHLSFTWSGSWELESQGVRLHRAGSASSFLQQLSLMLVIREGHSSRGMAWLGIQFL